MRVYCWAGLLDVYFSVLWLLGLQVLRFVFHRLCVVLLRFWLRAGLVGL